MVVERQRQPRDLLARFQVLGDLVALQLLTLALDDEAVETQVDCDKEGMISSVRILKASSEGVIKRLEEALVFSA